MQQLGKFAARHTEVWLVVGVTSLGAAIRLIWLPHHPPGLYIDEATNGLDALMILRGARPIYLSMNNGREVAFHYLVALSIGILGRSPVAIRLVSAILGTLTIPPTYLLGKALYSKQIGLLSSAILAIMLVPINLSRVGFRAVALSFVLAWFLWQLVRAWQTGRAWQWGLSGALYGLAFHTYIAARITPIALIVVTIYLISRGTIRRLWPGALWFALGSAMIVAPLGAYLFYNSNDFLLRAEQTAIIGGGHGLSKLPNQLRLIAGMFFVQGDANPRHNVPGRPLFDPLLALAFLWGLVTLWQGRRRTRSVFVVVWRVGGLLPTLLTREAPHFLRTSAMFPLLTVIPALGIDRARNWLKLRLPNTLAILSVSGIVVTSMLLTITAYYSPVYRLSEDTGFAYDTPSTAIALEVNRFFEVGWQGPSDGMRTGKYTLDNNRLMFMPPSLWTFGDGDVQSYLVPLEFDSAGPLSPLSSPTDIPDTIGDGIKLLIIPGDRSEYVVALPEGGLITAHWGANAQISSETESGVYPVYVAYEVLPWDRLPESDPSPLEADFEAGFLLVDYEISVARGEVVLRTIWLARDTIDEQYTLFVHVLSGNKVVGSRDGPMVQGLYPTELWRRGDLVLDERIIPLEDKLDTSTVVINIGFYSPESLERVNLVSGGDTVSLVIR